MSGGGLWNLNFIVYVPGSHWEDFEKGLGYASPASPEDDLCSDTEMMPNFTITTRSVESPSASASC